MPARWRLCAARWNALVEGLGAGVTEDYFSREGLSAAAVGHLLRTGRT
jgi:hypothetical protein